MKTKATELLRKELETSFGRKILSYRDCVDLSQDISEKTGQLISVPTLRRFFGLVKSISQPSFSTLRFMANYCGYHSLDELPENERSNESDDKGLARYVSLLFDNPALTDKDPQAHYAIVAPTVRFMNLEPQYANLIQRTIARTGIGQNYYFEEYINLDALHGFYGDGLRIFLTEKHTDEAQLLGHSLLALRYWLARDNPRFLRHADARSRFGNRTGFSPLLMGLFFGTELLKTRLDEADVSPVLAAAKEYYQKSQHHVAEEMGFLQFECRFLVSLLLVKEWDEVLYYASAALKKQEHKPATAVSPLCLTSLQLYKAIALAKKGKKQEATALYLSMSTRSFHFLAKKFHTLLYLQLGIYLRRLRCGDGQVQALINETGFVQMADLLREKEKLPILNKIEQEQ